MNEETSVQTTNLRLRNQWGSCPPNGYRYVFPEDGFTAHAWTYVDWINEALNHAHANNLPNPDPSKMEEQFCMTLPPGWCTYDAPNRTSIVLEWKDVLSAAQKFGSWLAGGLSIVPQEQALRRAEICSRCFLNVPMTGCSVCQATVHKVAGQLPKTKFDPHLRSCAVCHCVLRMKIWFPKEILDKETSGVRNQYKAVPWCWQNPESENYKRY